MTFDAFSRYLALETASRQVCVQPRPLTLRDAAAFAAERRRLLHGAHSYRLISPSSSALSSKLAARRCCC